MQLQSRHFKIRVHFQPREAKVVFEIRKKMTVKRLTHAMTHKNIRGVPESLRLNYTTQRSKLQVHYTVYLYLCIHMIFNMKQFSDRKDTFMPQKRYDTKIGHFGPVFNLQSEKQQQKHYIFRK